jgi:hypothetical protein
MLKECYSVWLGAGKQPDLTDAGKFSLNRPSHTPSSCRRFVKKMLHGQEKDRDF